MIRNFFLSLIFFSVLCLTGCTTFSPHALGISDGEWKSYDEVKRKQLRLDYQTIALANDTEDKQALEFVGKGETIEAKFSDGTAFMPPFTDSSWQAFAPVTVIIDEGTCQNSWLASLDGKTKVSLRSCYKNKILSLDPSRYAFNQPSGTMAIPRSPLWDTGFTYRDVNSFGYVKLRGVTVVVKQKGEVNVPRLPNYQR